VSAESASRQQSFAQTEHREMRVLKQSGTLPIAFSGKLAGRKRRTTRSLFSEQQANTLWPYVTGGARVKVGNAPVKMCWLRSFAASRLGGWLEERGTKGQLVGSLSALTY